MALKCTQHSFKENLLWLRDWFIRALKNNVYKYTKAVSKKVYINMLDEIFDKYNNTYHRTIRVKLANVKSLLITDRILIIVLNITKKILTSNFVVM